MATMDKYQRCGPWAPPGLALPTCPASHHATLHLTLYTLVILSFSQVLPQSCVPQGSILQLPAQLSLLQGRNK